MSGSVLWAGHLVFTLSFLGTQDRPHWVSPWLLCLCVPLRAASRRCLRTLTPSLSPAFPLAPRAFLAPVRVRVKELTGNQQRQGSSSFCLFETCHFLTSSAHYSWGTTSPHSPFPFPSRFYQLMLHFPSFSPFPARALLKLWTTLLLFSQSLFTLLYPPWDQGGVGKTCTSSFRHSRFIEVCWCFVLFSYFSPSTF